MTDLAVHAHALVIKILTIFTYEGRSVAKMMLTTGARFRRHDFFKNIGS